MIYLPASEFARIGSHARDTYPHECCGALVGRTSQSHAIEKEVVRCVPAENGRTEQPERRYLISSAAVREIERDAARDGLEVIGFYHSHPDHPPEPSAFDLEHAWPWYTYLIIGVLRGSVGAARAWRLRDDRRQFEEEELMIAEEET